MHTATIAKAKVGRNVRARVDRNAKGLSAQLARWLAKYGKRLLDEELSGKVLKASEADELAAILQAYGVRAYDESAGSTARASWIVRPQFQRDAETKLPKLTATAHRWIAEHAEEIAVDITNTTRDAMRNQVRIAISDALKEEPRPSAGELARRLRTQWYGVEGELPYAISNERAALIARTELGQIENKGIADGYTASGVKTVEWIAVTSDSKSGEREHYEMDGEPCDLPYDTTRDGHYFLTPLGNRLRYPGDPDAPIEDTANCRCTLQAVAWHEDQDE